MIAINMRTLIICCMRSQALLVFPLLQLCYFALSVFPFLGFTVENINNNLKQYEETVKLLTPKPEALEFRARVPSVNSTEVERKL